jgi:hypothetical protein
MIEDVQAAYRTAQEEIEDLKFKLIFKDREVETLTQIIEDYAMLITCFRINSAKAKASGSAKLPSEYAGKAQPTADNAALGSMKKLLNMQQKDLNVAANRIKELEGVIESLESRSKLKVDSRHHHNSDEEEKLTAELHELTAK